jgi:translation initiation factor IF-2
VVCILGHVDHGKTSLLDAIRKANVAAGEAGGITQHIGAYQIEHNGRKITFLDTPGHAAFTKMRARGASVTDIAVLVVAADDGFMPQTDEALKHAQEGQGRPHRRRQQDGREGREPRPGEAQMQERSIAPEDWGGETITVPVAAIKKQGIPELLDMILLQADVLELKANPKAEASGVVIESRDGFGPRPARHRHRAARHPPRGRCHRQRPALRQGPRDVRRPGQGPQGSAPGMPVRVIGWSGTPDSAAPSFHGQERPRGRAPRRGGADLLKKVHHDR